MYDVRVFSQSPRSCKLLYFSRSSGVCGGFPNRRRAERSQASNLTTIIGILGTTAYKAMVDGTPAWQARYLGRWDFDPLPHRLSKLGQDYRNQPCDRSERNRMVVLLMKTQQTSRHLRTKCTFGLSDLDGKQRIFCGPKSLRSILGDSQRMSCFFTWRLNAWLCTISLLSITP